MNPSSDVSSPTIRDTAKPRRQLPWGRRWLFRCMAIALGVGAIGLFEVALRVVGFGHDLQLIIPVPNASGWYQLNPRFDEPFFGQTNLSGPESKPFRLPKPSGTRRVLVVGGSTVIGFPYTPDLAFPRLLQEVLQRQFVGEERIEVLNAGITALNSSSEAVVVDEGVACDPDLIVVYTGHNEFYGPGGVASGAGSLEPVWFRRLAYWKRLRLFQLMHRLLASRTQSHPDLLDELSAERRIPRDSALFQRAVTRFEQNLKIMQARAAAKHIPLLLVSPVCNERDQPPLEPALPRDPVENEPAWCTSVRKAEHWLRYEQPEKALPLLQSARDDAPDSAIVEYRLGQAYDQLQQHDRAAQHYAAAIEADGTRFRAPAAFREVMATLARNADPQRVRYLDARAGLIAVTDGGVPDETHFLEHVHFTWQGNVDLALALARFIQPEMWQKPWSQEHACGEAELSELMTVQLEEHIAAETLAMMIYEKPPFMGSADAQLLAKRWRERTLEGIRQLSVPRREVFLDLTTEEMSLDPLLSLEKRYRTAGMDAERGTALTALTVRRPWLCAAAEQLAAWRKEHGEQSLASESDWPCLPP